MGTYAPELAVSLCSTQQLSAVLESRNVDRIYLEADSFTKEQLKDSADRIHKSGIRAGLALSYAGACRRPDTEIPVLSGYFDEYLVRSADELYYFREEHPEAYLVSDYGLYCMNRESESFLKEHGIREITAPAELNSHELKNLGIRDKQLIVYGYIPMMVSAQCLRKNTVGCTGRPEVIYLTDRKGMRCPVRPVCSRCLNVIYNSLPLSLGGLYSEIEDLSPGVLRIDLSVEDVKETSRVVDTYARIIMTGEKDDPVGEYTRGHFRRGVE